jgi:hypothetical protein
MSIRNLQIADTHATVVPSDTTTFEQGVLFIGVGGDVNVTVGGVTKVYKNVPSGSILYVLVTQVFSTSTTATDMLILR